MDFIDHGFPNSFYFGTMVELFPDRAALARAMRTRAVVESWMGPHPFIAAVMLPAAYTMARTGNMQAGSFKPEVDPTDRSEQPTPIAFTYHDGWRIEWADIEAAIMPFLEAALGPPPQQGEGEACV